MEAWTIKEFAENRMGEVRNEVSRLKGGWGWFVTAGIITCVVGIIAFLVAEFTTAVSVAFLGILLLIAGAVHIIHSFFTGSWKGFFLELLGGIVYGIAGILMVSSPFATAIAVTAVLGSLFMVGGVFGLVGSLVYRFPQWGWACFSGVISLVAGILIWAQLPTAALWVIGALVGIELFFRGFAMMTFGFSLRSLTVRDEIRTDRKAA